MRAQVLVTYTVVTGDALACRSAEKIRSVGDETYGARLAGPLQLRVALEASRVENVVFTVFTLGLPVDRLEIVGQLRPGIMHAESGLHEHVVDRIVMRYVALGTLGLYAAFAGAAVNVLAVTHDHRGHRVTTAAKGFTGGLVDHRIREYPRRDDEGRHQDQRRDNDFYFCR